MAISSADVNDDLSLQALDDGWNILPWLRGPLTHTTTIATRVHLGGREGEGEGGREGGREMVCIEGGWCAEKGRREERSI